MAVSQQAPKRRFRPDALVVLAVAIAVDYATVARFTTRVQLAPNAASLAATGVVVRHPGGVGGGDVNVLAEQIAAGVFVLNAPGGAGGTPTVETGSRPSVVATVGYERVAPSNFGSALDYGAISIHATATSLGVVADSRTTAAP